jgi:drug/metabolite transporter (DMT)-like permease
LSDQIRGSLLVLFGAFLWGTLVVVTSGVTWIQPATVAVVRAGLAALGCVLWLGTRTPRLLRVAPRDFLWLFFYGGATAGFMYAGFTIALSRLSVATSEVIFYTFPLFTTILGVFILRERPSGMQVFSCLLLLSGVASMTALTGKGNAGVSFHASFPLEGVLAAVLSMLGMTIQSLVARKNARKNWMPTETLFSWAQIFGFVWIALYKSLTTGWSDVPDVTPASWLILAYMGLVCTLLAYGAYNLGLRYISAATASMLASFEMVTAVVLAALALGAVPTAGEVIGSVVILIALVLGTCGAERATA